MITSNAKHLVSLVLAIATFLPSLAVYANEKPYFPPVKGTWETIDASSVGWNSAKLEALIKVVGEQNSSGLLILQNGKILIEKHWPEENYKNEGFRNVRMMLSTSKDGDSIEDVASAQKSISHLLWESLNKMDFSQSKIPCTNIWVKAGRVPPLNRNPRSR